MTIPVALLLRRIRGSSESRTRAAAPSRVPDPRKKPRKVAPQGLARGTIAHRCT